MLSDQFMSSWEELVNFDRLRGYRVGRVIAAMKAAGLDGLISFKSDSIRYMTSLRPLIWEAGYQTRNMAIMRSDGETCLYVASGDYQRVLQNDPWLEVVKPLASMEDAGISSRVVSEQFVPQLKKMGLDGGRIGVDATTFYTLDFIRKALRESGSGLQEADGVMREARAVKSTDEARLIGSAAAMVDGGLEEAKRTLAPGRSENEVAGAALRVMYALGTEWMPINPVVFSGKGGFRRFSTSRDLHGGECAVVNLSAMNDGYCAEATRTLSVEGKPEGPLLDRLRDAYDDLVDKIAPGATVDSFFTRFARSTNGKGVLALRGTGLSLNELPEAHSASGAAGQKLVDGNALVVEARLSDPGLGTAQLSDTILVTGSGHSMLTRFQEDA